MIRQTLVLRPLMRRGINLRLLCSNPEKKQARPKPAFSQHPRLGRTKVPESRIAKIGMKTMVGATAVAVFSAVISTLVFFETSIRLDGLENDDEVALFEVEQNTGVEFPLLVRCKGGRELWRVQTAVRCMLNWCWLDRARVYAFALYTSRDAGIACAGAKSYNEVLQRLSLDVAPSSKKKLFSASATFTGSRPNMVFKMGDQGLGYYTDTMNPESASLHVGANSSSGEDSQQPPEVLLRIVLARDVAGEHLGKGFDKTMLPRVLQAGEDDGEAAAIEVRAFTRMLRRQPHWVAGTTLDFLRRRDGALVVNVDDRERSVYSEPLMSWALFDAFLGTKGHFSSSCREAIAARLGIHDGYPPGY